MNRPYPIGRATASLAPSTRLHLWLKPAAPGRTAMLHLERGTEIMPLAASTAPEFVFLDLAPGQDGEAILSWSFEDTILSCLYAYEPDTVVDQGIRLLHVADEARSDRMDGFRFRPAMGWMNDPNGFCRARGRYHLFYQNHPHSLRWSDMHWGHATSVDLLHWVHQPILLVPGRPTADGPPLGAAFSGSAIASEQGLRVFFTDHDANRTPKEFQRSALVPDGLHAEPAAAILADVPPGMAAMGDFRDPFVFRGPDGGLHMVVGAGDVSGGAVLHYTTEASDGASGWVFRSILHCDDSDGTTVAECPCLVPISGTPTDPATVWALIYARLEATDPATGLRNPTRALVGRFDGTMFSPRFVQTLDAAGGSYAWQAFHDTAAGTIAIGWLASWADWDRTSDFPTSMTLPRRLSLSADGTALLAPPVEAVSSLRGEPIGTAALAEGLPLPLPPRAEVQVTFSGPLHLAISDGCLTFDQTGADRVIRLGNRPPIRIPPAQSLRLFLDPGGIEVFADDGRWTASCRLTGDDRARTLTIAPGSEAAVEVWPLCAVTSPTGTPP